MFVRGSSSPTVLDMTMLEASSHSRKRKYESEGDANENDERNEPYRAARSTIKRQRLSDGKSKGRASSWSPPRLHQHCNALTPFRQDEGRCEGGFASAPQAGNLLPVPGPRPGCQMPEQNIYENQTLSLAGLTLDHPMPDADPSPADEHLPIPCNEKKSSHGSTLPSLGSEGRLHSNWVLDYMTVTDYMPPYILTIPQILFSPRPPPPLPPHVVEIRFWVALARYHRLGILIDNYQRWYSRKIFGFWTSEEMDEARTGSSVELHEALRLYRPTISPRTNAMRFDAVLSSTPLLCHLIERYHKDLGFKYFGFFGQDSRDHFSAWQVPFGISRGLSYPMSTLS